MTRTLSRRENTVPLGGNLKMRVQEMDVTSYDQGGEDFAPGDVNMRRFIFVLPLATDNDNVDAKWVEGQDALRLIDGGSELAAGESETVVVVAVGV